MTLEALSHHSDVFSRARRDRSTIAARWIHAEERLTKALRELACVKRLATYGEPAWIAAELKVAEARQRWQECREAVERLDEFLEGPDLFC
jgi:hypothetical protein